MHMNIPVAGVAHQAGTCRFGHDPATSVLDANCKAHELDNLYVVDTSFFPSIGAVNPALTAMANAIRVGEHLARARWPYVRRACDHGHAARANVVNAAGLVAGHRAGHLPRGQHDLHRARASTTCRARSTARCSCPQVVTAITASLLGARLARRVGIKRVYLVGLAANLVAMALLVVSAARSPATQPWPTRCCCWPPRASASASASRSRR